MLVAERYKGTGCSLSYLVVPRDNQLWARFAPIKNAHECWWCRKFCKVCCMCICFRRSVQPNMHSLLVTPHSAAPSHIYPEFWCKQLLLPDWFQWGPSRILSMPSRLAAAFRTGRKGSWSVHSAWSKTICRFHSHSSFFISDDSISLHMCVYLERVLH